VKVGDLVRLTPSHTLVNLFEDDLISIENGDRFYQNEVGIILLTKGNKVGLTYPYHKILTPRSTIGWINEFHLRAVE
jgi:hypothetical protein